MDLANLPEFEFSDNTEKSFKFTKSEAIAFLEEELAFWSDIYSKFEGLENEKKQKFISASTYLEQAKSCITAGSSRDYIDSVLQNLKHHWIHSKHSFVPAYIEHAKSLSENALN